MKKIGVLGSGMVGKTLATGFLKHGYDVMIGSRTESKLDEWKKENPTGKTGNFRETAEFGEILVFAVKGSMGTNAIDLAGIENFSGKTIIDPTNPIDDVAPVNGVLQFFTDKKESLLEKFQNYVPKANFVKAFSSAGAFTMVNPDYNGVKPTMFICGNNTESKKEVKDILTQFGWEPEDLGMANAAGTIENLCILWCIPGFLNNSWMHAFKLLRK